MIFFQRAFGSEHHPETLLKTIAASTFLFTIWVFPKIGVPQNGWFRMENPIIYTSHKLNVEPSLLFLSQIAVSVECSH